jgi:hypothetical protein
MDKTAVRVRESEIAVPSYLVDGGMTMHSARASRPHPILQRRGWWGKKRDCPIAHIHCQRWLLALLLFALAVSPEGGEAASGDPITRALDLTAWVLPTSLATRGEITIAGILRNTSAGPVKLLPKVAYAIGYIRVKASTGDELRRFQGDGIPAIRPPSVADLVTLNPGEDWRMSSSGYLLETQKRDPHTRALVSGLFLDFRDSAFLVPGPGVYEVTVKFGESQEFVRQFEAHFGVSGVWHGDLVSPPVRIEVK